MENVLASKYYEKLSVGLINCDSQMKEFCEKFDGNIHFFEKLSKTAESHQISEDSLEEEIANLILPEIPIWEGSKFWKNVHSRLGVPLNKITVIFT